MHTGAEIDNWNLPLIAILIITEIQMVQRLVFNFNNRAAITRASSPLILPT